jgi:hypothetical protein
MSNGYILKRTTGRSVVGIASTASQMLLHGRARNTGHSSAKQLDGKANDTDVGNRGKFGTHRAYLVLACFLGATYPPAGVPLPVPITDVKVGATGTVGVGSGLCCAMSVKWEKKKSRNSKFVNLASI